MSTPSKNSQHLLLITSSLLLEHICCFAVVSSSLVHGLVVVEAIDGDRWRSMAIDESSVAGQLAECVMTWLQGRSFSVPGTVARSARSTRARVKQSRSPRAQPGDACVTCS